MASKQTSLSGLLVSNCNSQISFLSSSKPGQSSSSNGSSCAICSYSQKDSKLIIYTTILEILEQLFGLYTDKKVQLDVFEQINRLPLDPLILFLNCSTHCSENHDNIPDAFKKDLDLLLTQFSVCIKDYSLFKIIFPSNTALKLMTVFFQVWKIMPANQLAVDYAISLIGTLFYRNKESHESFTEAIFAFIQEIILDSKQKNQKHQHIQVLGLTLSILKSLVLQGINLAEDSGNKLYVTQTLEQNLKDAETFMDKFISFLVERYENSKHNGFKQLLKAFCEGIFQQITDPDTPISSKLGFKILERLLNILRTISYTLPHKIFYADLVSSFLKKNLHLFYMTSQIAQRLYAYAMKHKVKNVNEISASENSKSCCICTSESRTEDDSEDQGGLCDPCVFLLKHLDIKAKKSSTLLAQFKVHNLLSITNLKQILDFRSLAFSLLRSKTTPYGSQKSVVPPLFSFASENFPDLLSEDDFFDELMLFLKQVDVKSNKEQISSKMKRILYILSIVPGFAEIMASFHELCLILSNENSCSLRLKSIELFSEIAKTDPQLLLQDKEFMIVLEQRIYDSSPHLRLNTLEVSFLLMKKKFDPKSDLFKLVLDRSDDIYPAIRKAVTSFLIELLVTEEVLKTEPEYLGRLFQVLAQKTSDKEDIAAVCLTGLLYTVFPSFRPNNPSLKKILSKSSNGLEKKSKKKENAMVNENLHFEKVFELLRTCFKNLGQEWYHKMVSEASKIGTLEPDDIVQFIGFLLGKVRKSKENISFMFWLLKPFSENFPSQFVSELTYFQVYLSEYNKPVIASENQDEKKSVHFVCEILQNLISYHSESFTASQMRKLLSIEQELLQIVYKDSQLLVSSALKTLCISIKKLTNNFQLINELFLKCYNLFISHFATFSTSRSASSREESFDENSRGSQESQDINHILPSLIRSSYIVAYIIKYLGAESLANSLLAYGVQASEIVNGLYAKFCLFIDKDHGIMGLNQVGIECVAALWDYNPLLALKSRNLIHQFLAVPPNSEMLKTMQLQILDLFYRILSEYRQDNQKFLQKLDDNIRNGTLSAKKALPSASKKKAASSSERQMPTNTTSARQPIEQSSVIQLISECMALVVPYIYNSTFNVKILITRIVLLMMQEGHCHVHVVLPKIFALIGDDNEEIRSSCLAIVESAMTKNATIVSLELENSLVEAHNFEEKHKRSTVLYVENSEQKKISAYEAVYEYSLRYCLESHMSTRTCLDAVCTLIITNGNKHGIMKFLCEFTCAFPRIKLDHFVKVLSALRTHIERNYHKVIQLLKPIVKGKEESDEKSPENKGRQGQEEKDLNEEIEKEKNTVVEKNQEIIFSLFVSLVYTNVLFKIARESSSGKRYVTGIWDEPISSSIEQVQNKLIENDKASFLKMEFNYDTLVSIRDAVSQYLEISSYSMSQNVRDLYKTIKGLYKCKTECMELFELFGTEGIEEKKSMSKKKKKVVPKVEATPKKQKIRVVMKRNTTNTKKDKKVNAEAENAAGDWEEYEPSFAKKMVFDTEYKSKLRKRRVTDFKDPLMA